MEHFKLIRRTLRIKLPVGAFPKIVWTIPALTIICCDTLIETIGWTRNAQKYFYSRTSFCLNFCCDPWIGSRRFLIVDVVKIIFFGCAIIFLPYLNKTIILWMVLFTHMDAILLLKSGVKMFLISPCRFKFKSYFSNM